MMASLRVVLNGDLEPAAIHKMCHVAWWQKRQTLRARKSMADHGAAHLKHFGESPESFATNTTLWLSPKPVTK